MSDSVSQRVANMSKNHLECRSLGHAWKYVDAWRTRSGFVQYLECRRCGTERSQSMNKHGEPVSNAYSYAPGYLAPGVNLTSKRGRGEIRKMAMTMNSRHFIAP